MRELFTLLLAMVPNLLVRNGQSDSNEKLLYRQLFDGQRYEVLERPVQNVSESLLVYMGFSLRQLIALNEKSQDLHVSAWLKLSWIDIGLTWNPDDYGGVKILRVPGEKIWTPDVFLYNSLDPNFDSTFSTMFIIQSNGRIDWNPPGNYLTSCHVDISLFPFDEQTCILNFGSWSFDESGIDLQADTNDFDTSDYIVNGEWKLIDASVSREVNTFTCCPGERYPALAYSLRIRRRTLYFAFNLLMPCVLLSVLTIFGFTLPPESGEKISLQITILLSLCVFLQLVGNITPRTSEALPLMGVYLTCCLFSVSLSVVFTVLILNLHYRSPEMCRMRNWTRSLFLVWLPRLLMMKRITANVVHPSQDEKKHQLSNLQSDLKSSRKYSIVDTSIHDTDMQLTAKSILIELKKLTQKLVEDDAIHSAEAEWKFAARVVDRFCLFFTAAVLLIGTLIIFAPPLTHI